MALNYNSQSRTGVLGVGWNITGFSSIYRSNKNLYLNGIIENFDFSNNDQMMLDGQSLIKVYENNNEFIYRTEKDNFSKIVFYLPQNSYDYGSFKIYRKDGIIEEYGVLDECINRYTVGEKKLALAWHLYRVSDRFGNFMTYSYEDSGTGELIPSSIIYTGFSSKESRDLGSYEIKFYNESKESGYEISEYHNYNNNHCIVNKSRKYIYAIDVLYNAKKIMRYDIRYADNPVSTSDRYFIEAIKKTSYNEENINNYEEIKETFFEWSFYQPNYSIINATNSVIRPNSFTKSIALDFLGQNKDIEAIYMTKQDEESFYNVIKIGNNIEIPVNSECVSCDRPMASIDWDFNGDDELIFSDLSGIKIYNYSNNYAEMVYNWNVEQFNDFLVGDISGDGIVDILLIQDNAIKTLIGARSTDGTLGFELSNFSKSLMTNKVKTIADINGDGIQEIVLVGNYGNAFQFYSYSVENGFMHRSGITLNPSSDLSVYFRDFNGDAKADMCIFDNGNKKMYYSFGYNFLIDETHVLNAANPHIVDDFNNDGRADFLYIDFGQNIGLTFHYTLGDGFKTKEVKCSVPMPTELFNSAQFSTGDFDGNGITDILLSLIMPNPITNVSRPPGENLLITKRIFDSQIGKDLICSVKNGHDLTTVIDYSKFSSYSNLISDFPITKYRNKDYVVKQLYTIGYNNEKYDHLVYKFVNPLMHQLGKGFIGFQSIETNSYSNSEAIPLITQTDFEVFTGENKYFYVFPKKTQVFSNSILLREVTNAIAIKNTCGANYLCFHPIIAKSISKEWDNDSDHSYKGIRIEIQDINSIDDYGNSTSSKTLYDEWAYDEFAADYSWTTEVTNTYLNNTDEWLIGLIKTKKATFYHKLEEVNTPPTTCNETIFHYTNENTYPIKLDSIEIIPNNDLSKKVCTYYSDYDKYGNVLGVSIRAEDDNIIKERRKEFEYCENNRFVIKETARAKSPDEDVINISDYYHPKGMLKSKTFVDKNNNTAVYTYNLSGELICNTDPIGIKTHIERDWAYNITDLKVPENALYYIINYSEDINNINSGKSYTFFDKYGHDILVMTNNLNGRMIAVQKQYDKFNRLQKTSEPYFYDQQPILWTEYQYDELGRLIKTISPTSSETIMTYKGRKTIILNSQTLLKNEITVNVLGLEDVVDDPATGYVSYNYNSDRKIRSIISQNVPTYFEYDNSGFVSKVIDPDAGILSKTYNGFGDLKLQLKNTNDTIAIKYDELGRISKKTIISDGEKEVFQYIYNTSKDRNGFGQIRTIEKYENANFSISEAYGYDSNNRLTSKINTVDHQNFIFQYQYSANTGKLEYYTYPSGFRLHYTYDIYNNLKQIDDASTDRPLWRANSANEYNQLTSVTYGASLWISKEFDSYGNPKRLSTTDFGHGIPEIIVQDLTYRFDPITNNLMERSDNIHKLHEVFSYDPVLKNRLTSWKVNELFPHSIQYADNGNILNKTDITESGNYKYADTPHAVSSITEPQNAYISNHKDQMINFSAFNVVRKITQKIASLQTETHFKYGIKGDLIKTLLCPPDNPSAPYEIKYYFKDYEVREMIHKGMRTERHILYAPDGVFAIIENGVLNYVLKDIQGSFNVITDEQGIVIENLSFDPWGKRRNALTWDYKDTPTYFKYDRGFNGHRHFDEFQLIDMGGRFYDPQLARFISADPFIVESGNTQSHNRYSYALNNPFKYHDPTGFNYKPFDWNHKPSTYINISTGRQSGTHWSTSLYSYEHNYNMMSEKGFRSFYGDKKYDEVRAIMTGEIREIHPSSYESVLNSMNYQGGDYGVYLVPHAGKYQLVGSKGDLGEGFLHENGALIFSNKDAGMTNLNIFNCISMGGGGIPGWVSDPSISAGITVVGSMIGGMQQSYMFGDHNVKYAQMVQGKIRNASVLTRVNQMNATKMAASLKILGRGFTGLSIAASGYKFLTSDDRSGNDIARFVGAGLITATAFIPFVGPMLSIGLGAADSYGAFDGIYNYFE